MPVTEIGLLPSPVAVIREAFLRLETVVLAARHGECDADARLDVDELAKSAETAGVDEQSVVLDVDVRVQDRECLVKPTELQLRRQQVLLELVACLLQLEHFILQSARHKINVVTVLFI